MTSVIPIIVATKARPDGPTGPNLSSLVRLNDAPASECQINHSKSIPRIEVNSFSIRKSNDIWKWITINLKSSSCRSIPATVSSALSMKWCIQVPFNDLDRLKDLCQGIGIFNDNLTSQSLLLERQIRPTFHWSF